MANELDVDTLKNASSILCDFVQDTPRKLEYGRRQRKRLMDAADRGEDITGHYRSQWLQDTVLAVVRTVGARADAFNDRYPLDHISLYDMTDVAASLLELFKKKL